MVSVRPFEILNGMTDACEVRHEGCSVITNY